MVKIGQFNRLIVSKVVPFGVYLLTDEWGEVLLPNKVVPHGTQVNDIVDVFLYFDSEDRIIATTARPRVMLGGCACLKVVDVTYMGAFLDWGLDKDLFVPKSEQQRPMEKDKSYIVCVRQDDKERLFGSAKIDYFLDTSPVNYVSGEEVNLLIAEKTALGTKVIINDAHWGLIHASDIFQVLTYGKKAHGYIKTIRNDGKIDVVLRKQGYDNISDLAHRILKMLHKEGGFLPLHDKSPPEEISRMLSESKKSFKTAIGSLYKQGQIIIEENGIRLKP